MTDTDLRGQLGRLLEPGWATDAVALTEQLARIAGVLDTAFSMVGMRVTVVGGAAIALQAPGAYFTTDLDLVVEWPGHFEVRDRMGQVFDSLGFEKAGRHWKRGELFVEVPGHRMDDPVNEIRSADFSYRVVTKEVVLRDRIVGFKWWGVTAYGAQAIALLRAFGRDLDQDWLREQLKVEGALDALEPLNALSLSSGPVDDAVLSALVERLRR